ncbi:MAG: UDP-N-acetylmuramate dehydrogenase [Candidatus Andersenbacteria bacterium]
MKIQENISLAPLTTFNVGGPARYFVDVADEFDLRNALTFAKENTLPVLILGGGSNVLISDEGWPGLVVHVALRGLDAKLDGEAVHVTAAAGEPWDSVAKRACDEGWIGIEALSGIPGSVGGAVVQNAAAYGQALQDVVESVRAVEVASGEVREFTNADCAFRYRDSRFKTDEDGRWALVSVTLKLAASGPASFGTREPPASLARWFRERTTPATPADVRNAVLDIRESKGMVIMEGRERFASVGSFFKNPHVTPAQVQKVEAAATKLDTDKAERLKPWSWPQQDGTVKLSAAFLIEYTPFTKGYVRGKVGISPRQPLALINLGGATAQDVLGLAQNVQEAVRKTFGVELEPEVKLVGFTNNPLEVR